MKRASRDYTPAPSAFSLGKIAASIILLLACVFPFWRVGSAVGAARGKRQQAQTQSPQGPPGQQPPADQRPTITVRSELVIVPVTVKDGRGNLVGDLRQNEFRILEDGVEQRITLFSTDTVPLSAVVLLDDDLKTKASEQVQKSLVAMAGGFSAMDETAIGRFDAFYTPVLDFTRDNDQLITQLKGLDLNSSVPGVGSTVMTEGPSINGAPAPGAPGVTQKSIGRDTTKHINDAVHAAAELLRDRGRDRRKVIILVSDGVNAKNNTYSYEETLKLLLSVDVSIYAIGVDAAVINRGTSILSHYAHATGGDVYYAARGSSLPDLYSHVSEQARHQYTLGYVPSGTSRSQDYHSIEVRIRRPELTLLTRDGYYQIPRP